MVRAVKGISHARPQAWRLKWNLSSSTVSPWAARSARMPGDVTSAAYRPINSVAEAPALMTDDGTIITESMAILNHLGARGIRKAAGLPARHRRVRSSIPACSVDLRLLWYALEHEMPGAAKDALRAYGASSLAKVHAHLERMIEGKDWLLGDQRSLADAHFSTMDELSRRTRPQRLSLGPEALRRAGERYGGTLRPCH